MYYSYINQNQPAHPVSLAYPSYLFCLQQTVEYQHYHNSRVILTSFSGCSKRGVIPLMKDYRLLREIFIQTLVKPTGCMVTTLFISDRSFILSRIKKQTAGNKHKVRQNKLLCSYKCPQSQIAITLKFDIARKHTNLSNLRLTTDPVVMSGTYVQQAYIP